MLRATKDIMLPTTITGSLPRPSWYTKNLGARSFLDAMVNNQFREQYVDTVSIYLHEQEIAGLDIVTDGDAHFDSDVGGQSWTNYPPRHMGGFDRNPQPTPAGKGGLLFHPVTSCTTISKPASCRALSGRSRAATCNMRLCGRWHSA
jgi:5-methyltetrahydropteroyltriglutamate--homocysteine methyltransferase